METAQDISVTPPVETTKWNPEYAKLSPRALILVPTRELAAQVLSLLKTLASNSNEFKFTSSMFPPPANVPLSMYTIPDIAVATPGKMAEFVVSKKPRAKKNITSLLHKTRVVVVDEADWILTDPTYAHLISHSATKGVNVIRTNRHEKQVVEIYPRQFIFVGATLPPVPGTSKKDPRAIIKEHFRTISSITSVDVHSTPSTLQEEFIRMFDKEDQPSKGEEWTAKTDTLTKVLDSAVESFTESGTTKTWLVFVNSKVGCEALYKQVHTSLSSAKNVSVDYLHADIPKEQKMDLVQRYVSNTEKGKFRILVCTDVVSRGIDYKDVDVVVHFDFPKTGSEYLHRVGRSARNGASGTC